MPEILKISVALTSEQVTILKSTVDAGQYATISEVVREAVREWHHKRKPAKRRPKKPRKKRRGRR